MNLKNPNHPAPEVGKYYEWQGPGNTFYMGQCTKVHGSTVHFDDGPAMLIDGRYKITEPARAQRIPVYQMHQEARA